MSGSRGFVREMIKIPMVAAAKGSQAIWSIREEQILRDPYVSFTPFRLWPECPRYETDVVNHHVIKSRDSTRGHATEV